jgi:hypothetical protein
MMSTPKIQDFPPRSANASWDTAKRRPVLRSLTNAVGKVYPPDEGRQAPLRGSLPQLNDHTRYWSFFHAADLHADHEEVFCSRKARCQR